MPRRRRSKARSRSIAQGPVASQEIIKELGTNGGGFFNANSAHPFENPNALTNFDRAGRDLRDRRRADQRLRPHGQGRAPGLGDLRRHGRPVPRRRRPPPIGPKRTAIPPLPRSTSMRRPARRRPAATWKARRSASASPISALLATVTTDTSCGAVNSMHDSLPAARRHGAAGQHAARRGHLRRRRLGPLRHARLRHRRDVRRRADGRAHARISRQEARGEGGQDDHPRASWPAAVDPRLDRARRRAAGRARRHRQCRPARLQRDPLRLHRRRPATTAAPLPGCRPTRSSTIRRSLRRC